MRRVRSVLTSPADAKRLEGPGSVAYHDVSKGATAALGMTWRAPDGSLRWAAVIDRMKDGWVTFGGAIDGVGDLHKALNAALRGGKVYRPYTEGQILAMMFPHAGRRTGHPDASGLPDLARHAQIARRAVEEIELPIAMRQALRACLDRGVPLNLPRNHSRQDGERGDWAALTLATQQQQAQVGAITRDDTGTVLEDEPVERSRQRPSALTDTHRRRLRQLAEEHGSRLLNADDATKQSLIDLLTFIPDDWWPTAENVDAFKTAAVAIKELKTICGYDLGPLLSGAKGDWVSFAGRLYRAAGMDDKLDGSDRFKLGWRARDCGDPVDALMNGLMVPLIASRASDWSLEGIEAAQEEGPPYPDEWQREPNRKAARSAAVTLLYGDKSAPSVLETSRRWHGMQAGMAAEILRSEGEKGWPPLFHGEFRHGDVGIVAIRDSDALREEGDPGADRDGVIGLDHCVLSRLPQCLSGEAHMLSIRQYAPDGTWRRLSTCQVSLARTVGQPLGLKVFEHRGPGNAFPRSPAPEALAKFLGAFRDGILKVDPQALVARKPPENGAISRKCGYDWRDPVALARALAAWEPLMPKWARGHSPDGFMDMLEERGVMPAYLAEAREAPRF